MMLVLVLMVILLLVLLLPFPHQVVVVTAVASGADQEVAEILTQILGILSAFWRQGTIEITQAGIVPRRFCVSKE